MGAKPSATQHHEWTALGQDLQQVLRDRWLHSQPFQLRCATREQSLFVLVEHLLHVEPDSRQIFASLEQAIQEMLPELLRTNTSLRAPQNLPIQLFLRIAGYQQPYASHPFYLDLRSFLDAPSPPFSRTAPEEQVHKPSQPSTTLTAVEVGTEDNSPPSVAELSAPAVISKISESVVEPTLESVAGSIEPPLVEPETVPIGAIPAGTVVEESGMVTPEVPAIETVQELEIAPSLVDPTIETIEESEPVPPAEPAIDTVAWVSSQPTSSFITEAPGTEIIAPVEITPVEEEAIVDPGALEEKPADPVLEETFADPVAEVISEVGLGETSTDASLLEQPVGIEALEALVDESPSFAQPSISEPEIDESPSFAQPSVVEPLLTELGELTAIPPEAAREVEVAEISLEQDVEPTLPEVSVPEAGITEEEPELAESLHSEVAIGQFAPSDEDLRSDSTNISELAFSSVDAPGQDLSNQDLSDQGSAIDQRDWQTPEIESIFNSPVDLSDDSELVVELDVPDNVAESIDSSQIELLQIDQTEISQTEITPFELSEEIGREAASGFTDQVFGRDDRRGIAESEISELGIDLEPDQDSDVQSLIDPSATDSEPLIVEIEENAFNEGSINLPDNINLSTPAISEYWLNPGVEDVVESESELYLEGDRAYSNGLNPTVADLIENGFLAEPAALPDTLEVDNMDTAEALPETDLLETDCLEIERLEINGLEAAAALPESLELLETSEALEAPEISEVSEVSETPAALVNLPYPTHPQVSDPQTAEDLKELHRPEAPATSEDDQSHSRPRRRQWSASSLALGGAIGAFILVSGLYLLTRPCVLGACDPLERAKRLSQEAIQTARTTDSALELVESYKKLNEASYLLGTIPSWSSHHKAAQVLLGSYEDQSVVLGQVVDALEKANTAANRSQNPPHPVQEWREIQWIWREVISQLERIPSDSSLHPTVQRRMQAYQANLADINQHITVEQQAQERIAVARKAGQLAEERAGAAQSAENWQETAATWTAAIDQLRKIPKGTSAYDEAKQLLALYQPKLAEANTKRTQELAAAVAYSRVLNLAEQARSFEQQNQWIRATANWRDALTYARQIPAGSAYHSQVQPLISTYTKTLQQAEENSQRSAAVQDAQPALEQICAAQPRICAYTLSPQTVRVQFTAGYDRLVSQLMTHSQAGGSFGFSPAVVDQVNGLLRRLADISDQTQVPMELYDSQGTKLGIYTPSLSGYVPQ